MTEWKIPVDQVVDVKVLVVLAKGIDQGLGNVEPTKVEDELEDRKYGDEHVVGGLGVPWDLPVVIIHIMKLLLVKLNYEKQSVDKTLLPDQVDSMLRTPGNLTIKQQ